MKEQILVITATLGDRASINRTIQSVKEIGGSFVKHVIVVPEHRFKKLQEDYPEMTIFPEPKDVRGIYGALNYGLKTFGKHYKYITFINDDDFWLPGYKELIEKVQSDDTLDVVYGKVEFVDEHGDKFATQTSTSRYRSFPFLLAHKIVLFTQQATLVKFSWFMNMGGFDESYKLVADSKFWAESVMKSAKVASLDTSAAAYMISKNQLSSNKELQANEHERLLRDLGIKKGFSSYSELFIFRIFNIPVYIDRFFRRGKIKR